MTKETKIESFNAFPLVINNDWEEFQPGMSMLDWFAGQALVGLLSGRSPTIRFTAEQAAEDAFDVAEAMMKRKNELSGD